MTEINKLFKISVFIKNYCAFSYLSYKNVDTYSSAYVHWVHISVITFCPLLAKMLLSLSQLNSFVLCC